MIYTFTPNPAIDYYVTLDHLSEGDINRSVQSCYLPAGKGINVSKVLDLLEIPSVAIYFSGSFSGKYIEEKLNDFDYIISRPIEISGETRINIKILADVETAINMAGPFISEEVKTGLLNWAETLTADDTVIISGSLPGNMDIAYIVELGKRINRAEAKLILDVPNMRLTDLEELEVYLIKPNFEEFQYLLNTEITKDNCRQLVKQTAGKNIRNILVSLGADGSYYCGEEGCYRIKSPKVKVYSTVSAGDTTLATFVGMMQSGKGIEESLIWANAAGAAVVSNKDFNSRSLIEKLISNVELIKE